MYMREWNQNFIIAFKLSFVLCMSPKIAEFEVLEHQRTQVWHFRKWKYGNFTSWYDTHSSKRRLLLVTSACQGDGDDGTGIGADPDTGHRAQVTGHGVNRLVADHDGHQA